MANKEKILASAQKFLGKGQIAKAIAEYQKLVKAAPSDVRNRQKLAELLSREKRQDEAIAEYAIVAKHYADTGFYLKAIAVYKQVQKIDPTRAEVYHQLAELNEKQGLIGNALTEYRNLVVFYEQQSQPTEAVDVLRKVIELDPDNLNNRAKLTELLASIAQTEEASQEFAQIVAMLAAKAEHGKIVKLYERFHDLCPETVGAQLPLAKALLGCGQNEQALILLRRLHDTAPDNSQVVRLLGECYQAGQETGSSGRPSPEPDDEPAPAVEHSPDVERDETGPAVEVPTTPEELPAEIEPVAAERAAPASSLIDLDLDLDLEFDDAPDAANHATAAEGAEPATREDEPVASAVAEAVEAEIEIEIDLDLEALDLELDLDESIATHLETAPDAEATTAVCMESVDVVAELETGDEVEDGNEPEASEALGSKDSEIVAELELSDELAAGEEPEPEEFEIVTELDAGDEPEEVEEWAPAEEPEPEELEVVAELDAGDELEEVEESALAEELELEELEAVTELDAADELEEGEKPEPAEELEPEELEVAAEMDAGDELEAGENLAPAEALEPVEELELVEELAPVEDLEIIEAPAVDESDAEAESAADAQFAAATADDQPASIDFAGMVSSLDEDELFGNGFLGGVSTDQEYGQKLASEVAEEDTETHFNLGIAYKEMGLWDDAVAEFDQASRDPQRLADCLTLKGQCLMEVGRLAEAEQVFRRGLSDDVVHGEARMTLNYELALLFQATDRYLEALECFQTVADKDMFFRDVGERVRSLREQLGLEEGRAADDQPKGDRSRVSYL